MHDIWRYGNTQNVICNPKYFWRSNLGTNDRHYEVYVTLVEEEITIQLINKMPKSSEERHLELLDKQWVQIKEPKSIALSILVSIPIMVLNTFFTILLISVVSPISLIDFGINGSSISISINGSEILGILLILVIHEFIHLIFIPNFMKSDKTFIGVTIIGGFVYSEEMITKSRYILITMAPFIIISVILPLLLGIIGLLNPLAKFLILLNSMGSSVDILNLILIALQIPSNSYLTSNGTNTYWKM